MQNGKKLVQLCEQLLAAKDAESKANESRIDIEKAILAITGIPTEGTETHDAGDKYKVKIEQDIRRKCDSKAWSLVAPQIPEQLRPVSIVETLKVDAKGLRWLKDNEPGYYKLACSAIEEKPAKPSVKIEVQA